jgi:hypothetical protein
MKRLKARRDEAAVAAALGDAAAAGARTVRSRVIDRLEEIITLDIGGRGLAIDPRDNLVTRCRGNLERAARHMASEGQEVAIVTGFFVSRAERPAIETDGPCGAIALAWLLGRLGLRATLITDPLGEAVVRAGLRAVDSADASVEIVVFPFESDDPDDPDRGSNELAASRRSIEFAQSFYRHGPGQRLTHLVAVERAGPSHRDGVASSTPGHQNQVHNFRGEVITAQTAKLHFLFEFIADNNLPVRTIGIGDGGNEIGMGSIPRQVIHANIPNGLGARVACRIISDWTIACGVSNWGAYALGTAVAWLRGRPGILAEWSDQREQAVLSALVAQGAVDGVTARPEPTVDGLPLDQHLAIWQQIRDAARVGVRRSSIDYGSGPK